MFHLVDHAVANEHHILNLPREGVVTTASKAGCGGAQAYCFRADRQRDASAFSCAAHRAARREH
ncbi:hypothetical protein D3C80_780630 [compost metagenome]